MHYPNTHCIGSFPVSPDPHFLKYLNDNLERKVENNYHLNFVFKMHVNDLNAEGFTFFQIISTSYVFRCPYLY